MGVKSTTFAGELLDLVLNNIGINSLADALGSGGDVYIALHTSDPGVSGDQSTNEVSYTGYARVGVARDNSVPAWSRSGNSATNLVDVKFGACLAGSVLATYFSIGRDSSGSGPIYYRAQITSPPGGLQISAGSIPEAPPGAITVSEN